MGSKVYYQICSESDTVLCLALALAIMLCFQMQGIHSYSFVEDRPCRDRYSGSRRPFTNLP